MGRALKEIPTKIIFKAMDGDAEAMNYIKAQFKGYIIALSTRVLHDDAGNEYLYVDDDMCSRLETKLICSIIKDFKVLEKPV